MKAVSGKRMARLVEGHGWRLASINGSHHIYVNEGRTERIVIPIRGNQDLKTGVQQPRLE